LVFVAVQFREGGMKKILALIALPPLLIGAAYAQLFTPVSTFAVNGINSPGDLSDAADIETAIQTPRTFPNILLLAFVKKA
jgi:hypothetical protein